MRIFKNFNKNLFLAGILIFFSGFVCMHTAVYAQEANVKHKKPGISGTVMLKPDLQVHKIFVSKTGVTSSGNHNVRITVKVKNIARFKNCCGPFKIKLEWRKNQKSRYRFLRDSGIARLCYDPALRKQVIETRFFDDTVVPKGKSREYRVTLDFLGQVTESREDNNQAKVIYKPILVHHIGCIGVDIVLKKVEIKRTETGVYVKAYVKNRCSGSCDGRINIVIDESLIPGGSGGIVQPIGIFRIEPYGEYENTWVGVMSNPDGDSTYTVTANLTGCTDRNHSNNSCRVILRLGADNVTKNCN